MIAIAIDGARAGISEPTHARAKAVTNARAIAFIGWIGAARDDACTVVVLS